MKEETTLEVHISYLQNIYSDPKRDKRMHTASAVYICKATGIPKGEDDAKEAKIYALDEIPLESLVFDHKEIVEDYLKTKRSEKLICPLCGKENLCQAATDAGNCWCDSKAVIIPEELRQRIPFTKRFQSCICQACVDSFHKENN